MTRAPTTLTLTVLPGELAVARLPPETPLAALPAAAGPLWAVVRTADELSAVLRAEAVPAEWRREAGWRALRVEGPLDFALVGVLAGLAGALADAGVSLFALSTFDTDYLLVRQESLARALDALEGAGYALRREDGAR